MSDFSLPHNPNTGFLNGDAQNPIDIAAAIASLQAIERSSADLVALLRGSASQQQAQLDQLNHSSEQRNQMAERQAQAEQRQQQRSERLARVRRDVPPSLQRGADGRFLPNGRGSTGGNDGTTAKPMRGGDGRVRGTPDLERLAPVDPNIGMYQEFKSVFDGVFGGDDAQLKHDKSVFKFLRAWRREEKLESDETQQTLVNLDGDNNGGGLLSFASNMAKALLAKVMGGGASGGDSGSSDSGSSANNDPAPAETREQRRERVRRQWRERQRRNARSRTRFGRLQNSMGDLATRAGSAATRVGDFAARHEGKLAKIPMIGAAITGLMAASDFKDATNASERGKAMGEGLGGMAGTALGGVGGALLGPVGAMAGAAIGNAVGTWAGGTIGEVVAPYVEDWTDTLKKANLPKTMTDIWGGGVKPFFKGLGASLVGLKDAIVNAASDGMSGAKKGYDAARGWVSDLMGKAFGGDSYDPSAIGAFNFGGGVDGHIKEAAQKYGMSETMLRGFVKMEDGWTGKMSPTGAIGTGQFVQGTWDGLAATKEGQAIGMTKIGKRFRTAQDPRHDKRINTLATALLAKQNAKMLTDNGLPVTGENLYMMHNIGPGIMSVMKGGQASAATRTAINHNGGKGLRDAAFLSRQKEKFNRNYQAANPTAQTVPTGTIPPMLAKPTTTGKPTTNTTQAAPNMAIPAEKPKAQAPMANNDSASNRNAVQAPSTGANWFDMHLFGNVGQNVEDRTIAHALTGGIGFKG